MNIHQHIIKGIQQQLFLNDYLVLPNFGGFVLKTQASSFSSSGTSLLPPSKIVGFNVQLKQNDGILNNWLQERLSCSKQEATQHLVDFAVFCNSILQTKRRLSLHGIGFFYLDFENNICFEPERDTNFYTESFGLSAIQIKPILETQKLEKITERAFESEDRVLTNLEPQTIKPKRRVNYRTALYLTVFVLTLSSFLIFLITNLNVNGVLYSSLFSATEKSKYVAITYPEIELHKSEKQHSNFVADNNGIAIFALNKNKNIAVNVFENKNETTTKPSNSIKLQSKYEIVLGCFKKLKNAKRLVAQLKKHNIEASIKEKSYKGMHVVSVLGINDKVDAIDHLESIQNNYPKAWLKVNKD